LKWWLLGFVSGDGNAVGSVGCGRRLLGVSMLARACTKVLKIDIIRGTDSRFGGDVDISGLDGREWILNDRDWVGRRNTEISQLLSLDEDVLASANVDGDST
jgi:hypothetical protein